jgi:hypothetical protein
VLAQGQDAGHRGLCSRARAAVAAPVLRPKPIRTQHSPTCSRRARRWAVGWRWHRTAARVRPANRSAVRQRGRGVTLRRRTCAHSGWQGRPRGHVAPRVLGQSTVKLSPSLRERKNERKTYARCQACVKGALNQVGPFELWSFSLQTRTNRTSTDQPRHVSSPTSQQGAAPESRYCAAQRLSWRAQ